MTVAQVGSKQRSEGNLYAAAAGSVAALVVWEAAACLTSSIFNKAIASVSLGTAVYFGVKEIPSLFKEKSVPLEKKLEMSVALFGPTPESLKVFTQLLEKDDMTSLIWSYLTPKEVGSAFSVSKLWKKATSSNLLWDTFHKRAFSSENKVPPLLNLTTELSSALSEVCKARYLETHSLFSDRIGEEFYTEYFGDIGIAKAPPIPSAFIARAKETDPFNPSKLVKDTHLLVYVPKEITITVPAGSKLVLNEKGRLIEGLEQVSQEERALTVPMTINNILMLTAKYLKKGHATGISEFSWELILKEHGDERIEKARFSYLRKNVEGLNLTYDAQKTLARDTRYEVSPLIDRVLLNLLTYISSKAFVDRERMARTSTSVVGKGTAYQVAVGGSNRLSLDIQGYGFFSIGVALGVPSGSSSVVSP